jgi:hypothetical protein
MALRIARCMRRDRRRRVVGRPANGIVARRRRGPDLSLEGDIIGDPNQLK